MWDGRNFRDKDIADLSNPLWSGSKAMDSLKTTGSTVVVSELSPNLAYHGFCVTTKTGCGGVFICCVFVFVLF